MESVTARGDVLQWMDGFTKKGFDNVAGEDCAILLASQRQGKESREMNGYKYSSVAAKMGFYKSATAQNLADEENGLYGQSALFIFGQFLEETMCR